MPSPAVGIGIGAGQGNAGLWVLKKGAPWVASRRCYLFVVGKDAFALQVLGLALPGQGMAGEPLSLYLVEVEEMR